MKVYPGENQKSDDTINLSGDYLLEGRIDGRIESDSTVVVGPDAEVTGEILATKIIVQGRADAHLVARVGCELHSSSTVAGIISADHLQIEEGADFEGATRVGLVPFDSVLEELTDDSELNLD